MKVLFLYPNLYGMNMLPSAIGYFTTLLKDHNIDVEIFDTTIYKGIGGDVDADKQKAENLNARPFDDSILKRFIKPKDNIYKDFNKKIEQFGPDLIIMSCVEDTYQIGINLLKKLNKRPVVLVGGVFPTFAPELTFELSNDTIDYILRGEGENTIIEFCKKFRNSQNIKDIPGLVYREGNNIKINKLPKPINLDNEQPLPNFSLFLESRFYRPMQGKLRKMLPITTVRGCPYTCAYCNSPSQMNIHKKEGYSFLRKAKISTIYREIEHVVKNYQPDSLYFWADTFLVWSDKEFDKFCEMYSDFKLPFWIQTRAETVTEYKFKKLKEIGLLRVAFGIEHGNEKFRKNVLNRNIENKKIVKNLKIVTDLKIPISVNNIIGFPYENRELAFDTIELNRNIDSDGINAYTFTPFHGTPLRKLCEEIGVIRKNKIVKSLVEPTMLDLPYFTKEEIEGIRRCFVLYVKMPKNRWNEIKKAEKLNDEGNKIWEALKKECLENYMNFGDYDEEDDIDKI